MTSRLTGGFDGLSHRAAGAARGIDGLSHLARKPPATLPPTHLRNTGEPQRSPIAQRRPHELDRIVG